MLRVIVLEAIELAAQSPTCIWIAMPCRAGPCRATPAARFRFPTHRLTTITIFVGSLVVGSLIFCSLPIDNTKPSSSGDAKKKPRLPGFPYRYSVLMLTEMASATFPFP